MWGINGNKQKNMFFFFSEATYRSFTVGLGHIFHAHFFCISPYMWQHARLFSGLPTITFLHKRVNHVVDSKENQMFLFLR